ncbi:MAG: tripartite tricarboxylate transporter substrate binding protein [Burkholderiales bacterium]|nr:tripartite tricarboxylate transporter substrate binding protein [Burkholderiales bacterium]
MAGSVGVISVMTLVLSIALAGGARAQSDYPARPIRFVIPFAVGGIADIHARIVGVELGKRLGQGVVVENQPAAFGIPAAKAVLAQAPDGHTITLLANGTATSVSLTTLPFDPVNDFAPVASIATFDHVLVVNARSSLRSIADIVAAARARPEGLNVGTSAPGTTGNLVTHLFIQRSGIKAALVPHRNTGELAIGLLRNDLDLIVHTYAAIVAQLKDGSLRAVAGTGAKRSAVLPDVPTAQEGGLAGFDAASWFGIFVRAGTPGPIIARLNREINATLHEDRIKQRLLALGTEPMIGTPEDLHARLSNDIERWRVVIDKAGLRNK